MPRKKQPIKAVAYLRQSNSVEGSDSQARQSAACHSIASKLGYSIEREFFDFATSGTKAHEDRPELSKLMAYIEANEINVVICEATHRLAREVICGGVLIQKFAEMGVKVFDATGVELTDDSDPQMIFIRDVLLCLSQLEKQMLVQRMAKGRAAKVKRTGKKANGAHFYGEHDPVEQDNLREARKLRRKPAKYGKRKTFLEVAHEMNRQGRTNRRGGKWTEQTIRKILVADHLKK